MKEKKSQLVQTAARLYALGVEVEGARERLRALAASGTPYDAAEMQEAVQRFQTLRDRWAALERQYLSLRGEVQ